MTLQASHSRFVRILLLACFLSGAASLLFEVLWTRAFSFILGSTTQAAALVFAAFLTGLALGAWLFGSLSARLREPLRAYALLEVGIAFIALATGLILHYQADTIGVVTLDGAIRVEAQGIDRGRLPCPGAELVANIPGLLFERNRYISAAQTLFLQLDKPDFEAVDG